MATTTKAALRQKIAERGNRWLGLSPTSLAANTSTFNSTQLNRVDRVTDDWYNNMWVLVSDTSSNASADSRMIKDYSTSGGIITPYAIFTAAVESGKTFEIHPYDPTLIINSLNDARIRCFPRLRVDLADETVIGGNWLPNAHAEDWAATTIPDHYASSGSPTVSKETTIIRGPRGSYAMKITGGTSSYAYISQVEWPILLDLAGQTVTFEAYGYASAASKARLQAYTKTNAGTEATTSGTYHAGTSEYAPLTVTASIPTSLSDIQLRFDGTDATVYFDNWIATASKDPDKYHLPSSFVYDPLTVEQQIDGDYTDIDEMELSFPRFDWHVVQDANDRFIVFDGGTLQKRKYRLTGMGYLSSVSADTDTMEVSGNEVLPLTAMALAELYTRLAGSPTTDDVGRYSGLASHWEGVAQRELRLHGRPISSGMLRGLY